MVFLSCKSESEAGTFALLGVDGDLSAAAVHDLTDQVETCAPAFSFSRKTVVKDPLQDRRRDPAARILTGDDCAFGAGVDPQGDLADLLFGAMELLDGIF